MSVHNFIKHRACCCKLQEDMTCSYVARPTSLQLSSSRGYIFLEGGTAFTWWPLTGCAVPPWLRTTLLCAKLQGCRISDRCCACSAGCARGRNLLRCASARKPVDCFFLQRVSWIARERSQRSQSMRADSQDARIQHLLGRIRLSRGSSACSACMRLTSYGFQASARCGLIESSQIVGTQTHLCGRRVLGRRIWLLLAGDNHRRHSLSIGRRRSFRC